MNTLLSRRRAIGSGLRHAAVMAAFGAAGLLRAASESRGFKIGACEWSLQKAGPEALDVAREIGLDGIQANMGSAANRMWLRRPEMQQAYLDTARRQGIEIASLALGELNNVPLKSDPRAAIWLMDAMDVARALGVRVILVAQFYKGELKDDKAGVDRTVEILQEIAPRAERMGVILGIENYLSAAENLSILDRVGSPAVQVYYDVGNSTDKGYDIYAELRALKGRLCELHFKDAGFLFGKGRVDFKRVREAVDEIGYRGWIQIEAAAPNGLVPDYRANLAFLRPLFPKTV